MIQELIEGKSATADDGDEFITPPTTPKTNGSIGHEPRNLTYDVKSNDTADEAGLRSNGSSHSEKTDVAQASGESSAAADAGPPSAPPRRKHEKKNLLQHKVSHSPPRVGCNGLPPTPKVHMGACFSKVFNECPLKINCSVSWVHPGKREPLRRPSNLYRAFVLSVAETRDQHLLLGCDEGRFALV